MKNETKLNYQEPEMSIFLFEATDIIATSGVTGGFAGDEDPMRLA